MLDPSVKRKGATLTVNPAKKEGKVMKSQRWYFVLVMIASVLLSVGNTFGAEKKLFY